VSRTARLKLALTSALDNTPTVCITMYIYKHYVCKGINRILAFTVLPLKYNYYNLLGELIADQMWAHIDHRLKLVINFAVHPLACFTVTVVVCRCGQCKIGSKFCQFIDIRHNSSREVSSLHIAFEYI